MRIDILTIFPNIFTPLQESIIGRAQDKNLVEIKVHNLRNWTEDKHNSVDDRPFGGGPGMILKPEPIFKAVEELKNEDKEAKVILLSPQGQTFTQEKAEELTADDHLILICGRYEGVDQRVRDQLIDVEISIGDYVLTGGELPAMVIADAVVRLIPGVLGEEESAKLESFTKKDPESEKPLLDFPQYTKPRDFRGMKVPEVLLSGDHKKIENWRLKKAREKTSKNRPDML